MKNYHSHLETDDNDDDDGFASKYIKRNGKIFVKASVEKTVAPYVGPVVRIHVRNDRINLSMVLLDLLWINMYDNKIVTMDNLSQPIRLANSNYCVL